MTSDKIISVQPTPPDDNVWTRLRELTAARIGLKRCGASLSTGPLLDFRLAHAQARDAVKTELDVPLLSDELGSLGGLDGIGLSVLTLASEAAEKQTYLMRPDLGRKLSSESIAKLKAHAHAYDIVFVVSDGLSARAVQTHAAPVLAGMVPDLMAAGWRVAPLTIVRHGRVAIGDSVAALLRADSVAVLIGERPGLSAPDSMGAYVTWQPNAATSDAGRNCISNIRPGGIGYAEAAFKLAHLTRAMRTSRQSGVQLKDTSDNSSITGHHEPVGSGNVISRD